MSAAAPSPRTMPVRFFENGLQLRDGSEGSACASACIASPARRLPFVIRASDPPATIVSAKPCLIARYASPTAAADDEQAVDTLSTGPRSPLAIEICPAAALFIARTTLVGRTRPRPAYSSRYESSIDVAPPSPVPQYTPAARDASSLSGPLLSRHASAIA